MRYALLAFACACGGSRPSVTLPPSPSAAASATAAVVRPNPLPAGACNFSGMISQGCAATPRFAVIAGTAKDEASATKALAVARSFPVVDGYPFAIDFDELPAADFRDGVAIVLGLFDKERDARDEAAALHAQVVELATVEAYHAHWPDFSKRHVVVELLEDAPAFDEDTVRKIERDLPHDLKPDMARRSSFASTHEGVCRVRRGDVFVTTDQRIAELNYAWAPVRCDGREAFVLERATRFDAVVKHDRPPMIWQVVQVICAPVVESRSFGVPAGALGETHMDDDCY
jgi:hypothetical protein